HHRARDFEALLKLPDYAGPQLVFVLLPFLDQDPPSVSCTISRYIRSTSSRRSLPTRLRASDFVLPAISRAILWRCCHRVWPARDRAILPWVLLPTCQARSLSVS